MKSLQPSAINLLPNKALQTAGHYGFNSCEKSSPISSKFIHQDRKVFFEKSLLKKILLNK